jgi:hypothetical protein
MIDIIFKSAGGVQQNPCRDVICAHLDNPTLPNGRAIAERCRSIPIGGPESACFF